MANTSLPCSAWRATKAISNQHFWASQLPPARNRNHVRGENTLFKQIRNTKKFLDSRCFSLQTILKLKLHKGCKLKEPNAPKKQSFVCHLNAGDSECQPLSSNQRQPTGMQFPS